MINYIAVGYHGTNDADIIIENGIDINRRGNDVFLGRGFYIWRDSHARARAWQNSTEAIEVTINCPQDEMLNFTSMKWNKEIDIIRLYLKYFKPKHIYFGEFLDFIIDKMEVDIKLITIMDLKNKATRLHIQDPYDEKNKTIFSYGDIQICIKNSSIVVEPMRKQNES